MDAPELSAQIAEARGLYVTYQQHVAARSELQDAFAARDRVNLKKAVNNAENLDLNIDIMVKAKELLRELETAYRENKAAKPDEFEAEEPEPYDAAEEARRQRQELAKQARFDIKNFPNLRTADDFARGAILNKGKVTIVPWFTSAVVFGNQEHATVLLLLLLIHSPQFRSLNYLLMFVFASLRTSSTFCLFR